MAKGRAGKTSRTAKVHEQDYVTGHKELRIGMGHLPWPSVLSPSGLAPAICNHGLRTLPPDHPRYSRDPHLDAAGGEFPPAGGRSWVRARHVQLDFRCTQCRTGIRPDDLTEYREAIGG